MIALLIGLALGIGSSLAPGPCGLAVLSAAQHRGRVAAVATAVGAALGDATYAALGLVGVARAFERWPQLPAVLHAISGAVLIGYGVHVWRARPRGDAARVPEAGPWRGLAIGYSLLVGNPGALLTWTVFVGPAFGDASPGRQIAPVAGIACGTAGWFSLVAVAASRARARLGCVSRVVCGLMIATQPLAPGLEAIVLRCLAKQPTDRYAMHS